MLGMILVMTLGGGTVIGVIVGLFETCAAIDRKRLLHRD